VGLHVLRSEFVIKLLVDVLAGGQGKTTMAKLLQAELLKLGRVKKAAFISFEFTFDSQPGSMQAAQKAYTDLKRDAVKELTGTEGGGFKAAAEQPRVLLVLDNLHTLSQLSAILQGVQLAEDSLLIVTSRQSEPTRGGPGVQEWAQVRLLVSVSTCPRSWKCLLLLILGCQALRWSSCPDMESGGPPCWIVHPLALLVLVLHKPARAGDA